MALIRLTAENAGEVIEQVAGDFAELVRSSGKSPAFSTLEERASELEDLAASGTLEVEVILGEVEERWRVPVANWLQIDETILAEAISTREQLELPARFDKDFSVVRIRSGGAPTGRRAGQRTPPILVVVHTPDSAPDQGVKDAIFEAVQEHPLSLLLVPAETGWAKALAKLASRDQWICKAIGLELMAERQLAENLALSPWKEARPFMLGWSVSGSMGSLYEGLALALEREQRSLKSKRTVLDQKAAVSQQKSTGNASEIIAEARGYIQKQFDLFKAESTKRIKSVIAPFDGTLSQEIEASIKAFNQFEFEKKPKIFVVRVPARVQNHLLSRTREELAEVGRADLVAMGELFRKVQDEVERLIESKGGPPTVVHFEYLSDHELTTLLDRSIGIQRPYSGTLARRGPMDYFMAARRYQMIFFMMFSAFGLSFVRSYRQIMIPMTVLLLSFGLLNVINSTRKQEKETEELELEKARELLRSELRRSMNEVEKTWISILSNHLANQQAEIMERIESSVSSYFEGESRKATDEKILQQRQIKGLDQSERKIAEAIKKVQNAPQELEQLNSQLVQLFLAAVRPEEAGSARTPGAPALPRAGAGAASPVAKPAVPATAAAALDKLKGGKSSTRATPRGAGDRSVDLKKKLAEARGKKVAGRDSAAGEKPRAASRRSKPSIGESKSSPPKVANRAAAKPSPAKRSGSEGGDLSAKAAKFKERGAKISQPRQEADGAARGASADSKEVKKPTAANRSGDARSKRAAIEKRIANLERQNKAPSAAAVDDNGPRASQSAKSTDESDRGALMKKKAEEIKRKMAAAAKSSPEDESASQATGSESEPDRGAQMKKKAEEIKRKMAEAAEEKDSASLDKTVVASKPPTQDRGDTEGK